MSSGSTPRFSFPSVSELEQQLRSHPHRPMFPSIDDRTAWEDRRASLPDEGRALLEAAQHAASTPLPPLLASHHLDFARTGSRKRFEAMRAKRTQLFSAAVIGACLDPNDALLDAAQDAIWTLCEQSTWVLPSHHAKLPDMLRPHVDLGTAGAGLQLAEALVLLEPRLDPVVVQRVRQEIQTRFLEPVMTRDDWNWFHSEPTETHNNWAAVCAGAAIQCSLHLDEDPAKQATLIVRLLPSLQAFLNSFTDDGGCTEGVSYWAYGFGRFALAVHHLEHRLERRIDWFDEPKLREIARFPVRTRLGAAGWPPFADCSLGQRALRPSVVCHIADRFDAPELWQMLGDLQSVRDTYPLIETLRSLWSCAPQGETSVKPLGRSDWLPALQWLIARHDLDGPNELVLAAKGGHNAEEHNHNDVGAFLVVVRGRTLVVDPGAPQYTNITFSPRRYTVPLCSSVGHAVPVIDGQHQRPGRDAAATVLDEHDSEASTRFTIDYAAAYPAEAGLASLVRRLSLVRGESPHVELEDRYAFRSGPAPFVSVLPTFAEVDVQPGKVTLRDGDAALHVTCDASAIDVQVHTLRDVALKSGDTADLHFVQFAVRTPSAEGVVTLRLSPSR